MNFLKRFLGLEEAPPVATDVPLKRVATTAPKFESDGLGHLLRLVPSLSSPEAAAVELSFATLSERLPVIVRFLSATLNFDAWLQPCIDPRLSNFSRQHANFNPGMHALRLVKIYSGSKLLYACQSYLRIGSLAGTRRALPNVNFACINPQLFQQ